MRKLSNVLCIAESCLRAIKGVIHGNFDTRTNTHNARFSHFYARSSYEAKAAVRNGLWITALMYSTVIENGPQGQEEPMVIENDKGP